MWSRSSDPFEDGFDYKTGSSGWAPGGCDSSWHGPPSAPSNGNRGRRHSTASDSGDTGFGTSCSDSVEDQSSSSTGPSSFHRGGQGAGGGGPSSLPTAHVMPSPSSSTSSGLAKLGGATPPTTSHAPWGGSCHQLLPSSPAATPTRSPLDMKDPRPVRRWSSLTRLSAGGAEKPSSRAAPGYRCGAGGGGGGGGLSDLHGSLDRGLLYGYRLSTQDPSTPSDPHLHHHGSLDRGLLYGYRHTTAGGGGGGGTATDSNPEPYLPSSSLGQQGALLLLRSPGADPRCRYAPTGAGVGGASTGGDSSLSSALSSALSSPLKPSSLDLNYGALPESRLVPPGVPGVPPPGGGPLNSSSSSSAVGAGGPRAGVGGSPIQPAVRTQMWLSEQMEYRPPGGGGAEQGAGLSAWTHDQQHRDRLRQEAELNQMLSGTSLPVNTLVKIKEGLLRQRELEIDRQKQQILQLHARIRENELRAQQVIHSQRGRSDDTYLLKTKDSLFDGPCATGGSVSTALSERRPCATGSSVCATGSSVSTALSERSSVCCEKNGELARKVAAAELEVLHLNEFLKQNTQKYSEDVKKLEEKMKTRDRYISSLKKKCQRESEQNAEKQQRIETLEKYLADLPSLEDVHTQATQLNTAQQRCKDLEEKLRDLEVKVSETHSLMTQKDQLIDSQSMREKELVATVHSLQQKVEQCLEDGVRLPMMDLKHLEVENTHLLDTQQHNSKMIDSQKKQIDRLSQELTATERRLQLQKDVTQQLQRHLVEKQQDRQNHRQVDVGVLAPPAVEAGSLLKEMSLCLLDLQALCSVLVQRAHGQEPNLSLLLGIQSMGVSGEENDNMGVVLVEEGLRAKLLEGAGQLRRDIDELRKTISDRYAQDMGENCVTQ